MNKKILPSYQKLQSLTKGVYLSLVGDEPYLPFVYKQGIFDFEVFLGDKHALIPYDLAVFLKNVQIEESGDVLIAYEQLLEFLKQRLTEITVYGFGFPETPYDLYAGEMDESFFEAKWDLVGVPIILGKTAGGEWMGMMLQQKNRTLETDAEFLISGIEVGEEVEDLIKSIEGFLKDIPQKVVSRNRYVGKAWTLVLTCSREDILTQLLMEAKYLSIQRVDTFLKLEQKLKEMEKGEEMPKEVALNDFFQNELDASRVYNLEYVIGGEWLGIHYAVGVDKDKNTVGVVTDSFTF